MLVGGQLASQAVAPPPGTGLFGWRRTFRRMVGVKGVEAKDWVEALERVIADLDLLNRNTEQDFLTIGGKLSEFTEAVNLISAGLQALAKMMSEEQGLRASQALASILDRFTKLRASAEESNGLLDSMLREAGQVKRTLSEFKGAVSTFTTLGVLIQIETARLGAAGADFGALADDANALSRTVQERVENALETARQLIPPIESALVRSAAFEKRQAIDLPSMITGVLAQLASFTEMQQRAHQSSVRMRSRYEAISEAFKKLTVSIQFHDITRQQVEHAIEILRRLSSHSPGQDGGATVLTLQSSQLADAGEKFAAATAAIARSLDEIGAHVLEMAEESRNLSGFSEGEQNSFFLRMEQACSAILAGLVNCDDAETANESTHKVLAETIGRMREAIEMIQAVEIQMERLALNASIRAAHLGRQGDALGVLAGTMQQLALDSGGRSESLLRSLGSMSQAGTRLAAGGVMEDSNQLEEAARVTVGELHSSSERSFAQIAQITARSTCLREDLSATRDSFSVGSVFAEAIERARRMIGEIARQTQPASPLPGSQAAEQDLDHFAGHYTMQAERDVHDAVRAAAGGTPAAGPGEEAALPAQADELGENVEFF